MEHDLWLVHGQERGDSSGGCFAALIAVESDKWEEIVPALRKTLEREGRGAYLLESITRVGTVVGNGSFFTNVGEVL